VGRVQGESAQRARRSALGVLMTADAVGGVWSYALRLAAGLAPHGVRTTLAVLGPSPDAAQRQAALAVPGLTLLHRPFRLEWMDDPWADVERSGEWLAEVEESLSPDVVHLNGYALAARRWRAPVVVVAHSCVLSWWEAVRGEPAPAAWDGYRRAVAAGVHAADVVVAPTRAMLAALERHYGAPRAAAVIANAADAREFAPRAKEPFVLTAGRLWDEAKNVAALDAAAAALPWPVYVAGGTRSPDGGERTLAAARPLGVLNGTALAEWMGRAAVYALPARYEPFGLSALEAALAGCALVLGDIPSLRELWDGAARFVAPGDTDALAAALRRLAADADARDALAARARKRALTLTPERMARGYLAQYERALAGTAADLPHLAPA
jgi:glycosyltransferase involved in cell wall biosynthesis